MCFYYIIILLPLCSSLPLASIRRQLNIHSLSTHIIFHTVHPYFFRSPSSFFAIHIHIKNSLRHMVFIPPYHASLLLFNLSVTAATFRLPLTYSLRILSILVTPHIHLNIRISATCSLLSSTLLVAQHSDPYNRTGLMTVKNVTICRITSAKVLNRVT